MYMYYRTNFKRKQSYWRFAGFGIANTFFASAYGGFLVKPIDDTVQRRNISAEAKLYVQKS